VVVRQLEKANDGTGWYTDDTKEAVALTSRIHPEVLTPEGRTTFLDLAGSHAGAQAEP